MISNKPSTGLWLARSGAFWDEAIEMLAWGQQWAAFFGKQPGITQAWLAKVDREGDLHWISNFPMELTQLPFSNNSLRRAIKDEKKDVFQEVQDENMERLFPLEHEGQIVGLIGLLADSNDHFKPDTIKLVNTLSPIIAREIFQEDYRHREKQAEFSINRLLQSSLDIQNVASSILEVFSDILKADAIILLSHNPTSMNFDVITSYGWEGPTSVLHEAIPEHEILLKEKMPIWIEDLRYPRSDQRSIRRINTAKFRAYLALPLIGHNEPLGILEIFWCSPKERQEKELLFLERMVEQISIAMERSSLWNDLRQKNQSLTLGYDALIEGLSRTLELRDFETEGHTRRVSLLTMRLLKHMKIPAEQWEIIRRGALLHDIGKLGIPDAILLKPGSLTEEEKRMMQQHVIYGHNILTPIINARQILDIVLHHHERWDGTGYPDKLKGTQIPIVARIFAVVDVFDALTSDRPYRTAWSHSQALDYLREQSEKQFDPHVVNFFLEIANDTR